MTILISIATLVLITLFSIAAYYLTKLQKIKSLEQEQAAKNQEAWLEHRDTLIKDIKFIANSMLQEQCEITEGCMRLGYLIPKVDDSESIKTSFNAIFSHYALTAGMPIKDAYKALTRKQQFKLDSERLKLEAKNKPGVLTDSKALLNHIF